jgi:hypothetical protein
MGNLEKRFKEIDKTKKALPVKPKKPKLSIAHTADEAEEYSILLREYEESMDEYSVKVNEIKKYNSELERLKEAALKDESEFYAIVPEKYQDKVYALAYDEGHAYGYSEIYSKLLKLMQIFE